MASAEVAAGRLRREGSGADSSPLSLPLESGRLPVPRFELLHALWEHSGEVVSFAFGFTHVAFHVRSGRACTAALQVQAKAGTRH